MITVTNIPFVGEVKNMSINIDHIYYISDERVVLKNEGIRVKESRETLENMISEARFQRELKHWRAKRL